VAKKFNQLFPRSLMQKKTVLNVTIESFEMLLCTQWHFKFIFNVTEPRGEEQCAAEPGWKSEPQESRLDAPNNNSRSSKKLQKNLTSR
jgi:hypothetical protein